MKCLKITKKEIQTFKAIVIKTPETVSEISYATSTSLSYISTTLTRMQDNGLITKEKNGKKKRIRIADTIHASILRSLILVNPLINLDFLTNKGTTILANINCQNLHTKEELLETTGVSYRTLWKHMNRAKGIGLITKNETFIINSRYQHIIEFIESYQRHIQQSKAVTRSNDAVVKWGCGENYIFETKATLDLQRTGISAFQDYGALFLTPRNLYTNIKEKLSIEDHIIHQVLSEGKENTLPLLITWMLNIDDLDTEYIKKRAYRFKASEITDAVQRYLNTEGKEKPDYLLNWKEFLDKLREYNNE